MLENFALSQLQEAEAQLQHEIRFQQDGAPPHWSHHVRALLNQVFPSRWIGRDGPIAWPPRSPDLTPPPRLLFMGYVKDKVYATPVPNINELRWRITDVVSAIPQATLYALWREMHDRLDICRATNGAHVEGH
jgi:hypothetical protein